MGITIQGVGIFKDYNESVNNGIELVRKAAQDCFKKAGSKCEIINLLINVYMYRDEYFGEPAFANFVQRDLKDNLDDIHFSSKTFVFDLINGSLGFLSSCNVAENIMSMNKYNNALIVSGDVVDIEERKEANDFSIMGAAILLKNQNGNNMGFGQFFYKYFPEYADVFKPNIYYENKQLANLFDNEPLVENAYLDAITKIVNEFLFDLNRNIKDFDLIIPPQVSSEFIQRMSYAFGVDERKFVDITFGFGGYLNSSLPATFSHLIHSGIQLSNKKALIIGLGNNFNLGCAVYNF